MQSSDEIKQVDSPSVRADVPYARNDWTAQPAGENLALVRRCTGTNVIVPVGALRILQNWRGLENLDDHVRRVAAADRNTPAARRNEATAMLRRQLEECARGGLLISVADILSTLAANEARAPAPQNRISTFAIPTRNRPKLLRRALESYVQNAAHFDRRIRFLVMDDSTEPAVIEENRQTIAMLRQRFGLPIEHIGAQETTLFQHELERRSGVDPEVLAFALFGAYGANRNRLSLRTVGERIICADDDTICEFRAGETATGWALESRPDRDIRYFPDRKSALSFLPPVSVDLIGLYEPLLGARPSTILAASPGAELHAQTLDPNTLRRLLSPDSRILYCMPGIAGDCAQSAPFPLVVRGAAREQLLNTEGYVLASRTREIVRCVPRPTLTISTTCVAYCLGLDNEVLTPPFFTRQRNSDGVYGFTLAALHPDSMHAELPQAVIHDPEEARSFNGTDVARACYTVRVCDIVMAAVRGASRLTRSTSTERRLESLGKDLCDMTRGSLFAFEEAVRVPLNTSLAARADELSQLLYDFQGEPKYWAKDIRRAIDGLHARIADSSPVVPDDLKSSSDALEVCQAVQRDVKLFGRVMTEWVTLRQAAAEIYAQERA